MEDNFYTELIDRIKGCMDAGQYAQAQELLREELSMPYVPAEYLRQLEEFDRQVRVLLHEQKVQPLIRPEELRDKLTEDSQSAMAAIRSLRGANVRSYLDEIRECLAGDDVHHLIKTMLLEVLIEQNVSSKFIFRKEGRDLTVDPAQLMAPTQQVVFLKLNEALEKLLAKNPSFLQQAQILAVNLAYDLYPEYLEEEKVSVYAYSIIRYLYQCYDEEEQWRIFAASQNVDEGTLIQLSF